MKKYKVTKSFPGFYKDSIIDDNAKSEFKCEEFPEFFEEVNDYDEYIEEFEKYVKIIRDKSIIIQGDKKEIKTIKNGDFIFQNKESYKVLPKWEETTIDKLHIGDVFIIKNDLQKNMSIESFNFIVKINSNGILVQFLDDGGVVRYVGYPGNSGKVIRFLRN